MLFAETGVEAPDMDEEMSERELSEIELSGDEDSADIAGRIRDRAGTYHNKGEISILSNFSDCWMSNCYLKEKGKWETMEKVFFYQ